MLNTLKPIFLMGPTTSGKTEAALSLRTDFDIEIISVDSASLYRGMDIGSGKPTLAEQALLPHHLLDIRNPDEAYSVATFCQDAHRLIIEIQARGGLPLLVGGTMLYFKALQQGLAYLPPTNWPLRRQLEAELSTEGLAVLYQRLAVLDPESHQALKPQDSQRILRALEVVMTYKRSIRDYWRQSPAPVKLDAHAIALRPSRMILHERIERRFRLMLEAGLIDEVRALLMRFPDALTMPALRSVGYRQVVKYLQDELSYEEMVLAACKATRQLAKRQETWLNSWPCLQTLDSNQARYLNELRRLVAQSVN